MLKKTTALAILTGVVASLSRWHSVPEPVASLVGAPRFAAPQWAFPTSPAPDPLPTYDAVALLRVPTSSRRYTMAQAKNGFDIVDWFPASHPPMPRPVQYGGAPTWRACGFCHLPDGRGRPENATLAGLPEEYFKAQVVAFRDKTRLAANPLSPTTSMHQIAAAAPDSDVATAAHYFGQFALTRRNTIVESARVPKTRVEGIMYALDGKGTEPIAGRLIEVPDDFERHELRDPNLHYTTYVPTGSIARGAKLAREGPAGIPTACVTCHGPQLLGVGLVPPIAGRSPSYILRQLMNIKAGTRQDAGSIPMQAVVEKLGTDEMVALAAYVGSLSPSAPTAPATRHLTK